MHMRSQGGTGIRRAAVAGMFYPADASELREQVKQFLLDANTNMKPPKAIIAPHAGYIYSGPVAATAYATLLNRSAPVTRVVLLGPDHRVGFHGIAASSAEYFETPLGKIPLDQEFISQLPNVSPFDEAHAMEHSLEVHLPFLQMTLDDFSLVPLVIGGVDAPSVAELLRAAWDGPETLIVISSDLSHYHDYRTAQSADSNTTRAIETLNPEAVGPHQACGYLGVRGLLGIAKEKGLREVTVDQRNSGDTAGPRDHVVGYGAYLFYETA